MGEVTQIFDRLEAGDSAASAELLPLVYNELRLLALRQAGQVKQGTLPGRVGWVCQGATIFHIFP